MNKHLVCVCLAMLMALTQMAAAQDQQVMVRAKKGTKLAPELVATQLSKGQLLGVTQDAQAVIKLQQSAIANLAAAPNVMSYNKEVPETYDEIKRLILSYEAGRRPTDESLQAAGLRVVDDYEKGTFLLVEATDGIKSATVDALESNDAVTFASSDYTVRIIKEPNDPHFPQLWGMRNIHAPSAWDKIHDSPSMVVAVIDTGVDYEHEDLKANIWVNDGEVPNNGIDDDGNGEVDDIRGWDYFADDNDPMDENNHGTHCAGTIGAIGDNGIGVVGVTWNVKIMALRFLSPGGSGSTFDAIQCVDYAAENGAHIMSNSWGGGSSSNEMEEAIERAKNRGVIFVAAAGNSATNNDTLPHYPSSYENENIIAVASINEQDANSSFSCFGKKSVDIGAPGSDILSTVIGNGYDTFSGTSMATPHVSGALALIWAANPSDDWTAIREKLYYNARPIPALEGLWGHDAIVKGGVLDIAFLNGGPLPDPKGMPVAASDQFGFGQTVDADATIAEVKFHLDQPMLVQIHANSSATTSGDASLFTTGFFDQPSPDLMWYESLRFVSIPKPNQWVNFGATYAARLPAGDHKVYWKITLDGAPLKLDSGSISVQAFADSSGTAVAPRATITVRQRARTSFKLGPVSTDSNGNSMIRILRGHARDRAAVQSSTYTGVPAGRR